MNSKDSKQPSSFDDLPNEILVDGIFSYFSLKELYYSYFDLNRRINNSLQSSTRLTFTINASNRDDLALSFFTPCIANLTVCLGNFDISLFSGLRSLILQYPSRQQRASIRPENFPFLTYLNLSYEHDDPILFALIFSNGFQHLKKCKFDRIRVDHNWSGSPKLRLLAVSVYSEYGIVCVLRASPNLTRLHIIVHKNFQPNLSLPRESISCENLFLKHLFIRSTFKIFTAILGVTSNLEWLTFDDIESYTTKEDSELNFELLAGTVNNLQHLSYLHLKIARSITNKPSSLQNLHHLFKYVRCDGHYVTIRSTSDI